MLKRDEKITKAAEDGRTRLKEVDLEFVIRRCHVADETGPSLLGKATFLETYADSTRGADLLSSVDTEHSPSATDLGSKLTPPNFGSRKQLSDVPRLVMRWP
jgi:hypothetical protein